MSEMSEDSLDGSSSCSTPRQGLPPPSPLCLFYFSHPFKIGTPEHVDPDKQEMARHRLAAMEAVSRRREKMLEAGQYRGTLGTAIHRPRQYLPRRRFQAVRHLGSYLLAATAGAESKSTPSLDEVLRIIREAWTTPRSSSLDREAETKEVSSNRRVPMGTTGRKVSPGGQRARHQLPSNPRPGLPHRRYSVPETVMRKYTLTKQREVLVESPADSSTTTATAPAAPYLESSSDGENRLPVKRELYHDEQCSGDSGGEQGGASQQQEEQQNRLFVTREMSHEEGERNNRSDQEGVFDKQEEHVKHPAQVTPRVLRKSSPGRSKPPSRTSTVLDTVSEETGNDLAHPTVERDDWTSSSATLGIPISTSATTGSSPQEDIAAVASIPQRSATSCPALIRLEESNSSDDQEISEQGSSQITTTKVPEETSPSGEREKEQSDTPAEDLSSTQTFGRVSAERSPSEARDSEQSDTMPNTTPAEDLSSTQTFGRVSTERSPSEARDTEQSDTMPNTTPAEDLSSTQTFGRVSTERSPSEARDTEQSDTMPNTTPAEDLSSTQTFGVTSTEPSSRSQSHGQQESKKTRSSSSESAEPRENPTPTHTVAVFSTPDLDNHDAFTGIVDIDDTLEPQTTMRDELSSSQTFGIVSEDDTKQPQDARVSSRGSEESTLGRISGESMSTPEARAGSSTSPERLPPSEFEKTTSGYSGEGTTTECCVSTSPSCSLAMSTSSPDQPVTERSTSTQDQTFSVRSESVTFGRPASVIRTPKSATAAVSDSEQSLGHIEFMNKDEPDFKGLFSNSSKSSKEETQSQGDNKSARSVDEVFGSQVNSPEVTRHNMRDIACQVDMCGDTATDLDMSEEEQNKTLLQSTSLQTTEDSGHVTEDVSFCGTKKLNADADEKPSKPVEMLQRRSWEIIIQPSVPKCYGTVLSPRATFRTLNRDSGDKISVLPSKVQEMDFFSGPKTYLVIRPAPPTVTVGTKFCSSLVKCGVTTSTNTPMPTEQETKDKPEVESVDGGGPYGWSRLTEEERTVRMQHQKHRLWMNRRLASAHALPRSPDPTVAEGALSACVGPGSSYREPPLRDTQLVVPRYSALPRSVSMLVNTSSGECSSNSNSDSECLSLVDSLDESPNSKSKVRLKHDIAIKLLPETTTTTKQNDRSRIHPATPRGKGKAFFVSMAGGLDKLVPVDKVTEPVVAQSMPDKLKKKLSQRQEMMELRRRKKQAARHSLVGEGSRSRESSAEALQPLQISQELTEDFEKLPHEIHETENGEHITAESLQHLAQEIDDVMLEEKCNEDSIEDAEKPPVEIQGTESTSQSQKDASEEIKNWINRKSSKEADKNTQQSPNMTNSSQKSNLLQQIPSPPTVANISELKNGTRDQIRRRKSRSEKEHDKSQNVSDKKMIKHSDINIGQQSKDKEEQNKTEEKQELTVEKCIDVEVIEPESQTTRKPIKHEQKSFHSKDMPVINPEATESKNSETISDLIKTSEQIQTSENSTQAVVSKKEKSKPKRKCRDIMKRAKSEPPPKVNKSSEEEIESKKVAETVTQPLFEAQTQPEVPVTPKGNSTVAEQEQRTEDVSTSETSKLKNSKESVISKAEKLAAIGKGTLKGSPSPENTQTDSPEVTGSNKAEAEPLKLTDFAAVPKRPSNRIPIDHVNCQRTDYGAETIKTRPQHRKHRVRKKSPPATVSSSDSLSALTPATSPAEEGHPTSSSLIPVMKSPISMRRSLMLDPANLRPSQLPVLRSRFLQSPPVRRSANLRFQQRFEVIPEERSASLESSPEDQAAVNQQKSAAKPVRPTSEAHPITSNRYRPIIKKTYRNSTSNYENTNSSSSNSSNQDDSSNGTPCRVPIKRPLMFQSKIPRPGAARAGAKQEAVQQPHYNGSRAALAPHTDDNDLVTLSKGWLNFYLLKDGRGTPDSTKDEASSANNTDKEERLSAKRTRSSQAKRTVTVLGADDNRVRQYTLSHQNSGASPPLQTGSPEQPPEERKSEELSPRSMTLPALDTALSRRSSLEKLPLELPKVNEAEDSDHSTTYLCLPSPNRQRRVHSGLLEGSGELACSESSSMSSSDEGERVSSAVMFPVRWPSRPTRNRVHRSRSRSNHCRRELIQSYLQTNNSPGSAGWTVTLAGSNGGPQQQPPDLEMHVTFPANIRRTAASQSDSGLGEDNNGGGGGGEEEDSKSRRDEEEHKADDDDEVRDPTQTHRWTVVFKNQNAAEKVAELTKTGKRSHHCLPDLSYHQNQSKNSKKAIKKTGGSLPVTSVTDEDARKGNMQRRLSLLWPKVQKIIESKVIIRKANGHFSQEVKSVSQLLENDIGEMMVRSGLAIKGSAITPEKKPRVPTMSERDLTRAHTARH